MRKSFGFQRLNGFNREAWEEIVNEALNEELEEIPFKLFWFRCRQASSQSRRAKRPLLPT